MNFTLPQLIQLAPAIIISLAVVVIMLGVAIKRNHAFTGTVAVIGLNVALLLIILSIYFQYAVFKQISFFGFDARHIYTQLPAVITSSFQTVDVGNLYVFDGFSLTYSVMVIIGGLACCTLMHAYIETYKNNREEVYMLILVAVVGGILLTASSHMASFFISLELLSVSSVGMLAYTHERGRALEAGIKYLVVSATASASILMGMAFLYAYAGDMQFINIGKTLHATLSHPLAVIGATLVVMGMAVKLSLFPFHAWTPDVYQGAPSPVTTFLATVSKTAALAVVVRFLFVAAPLAMDGLRTVLAVIAVLSIVIGNLLAVNQVNLKRLLGYSSIAHMGYMLVAILCLGVHAQATLAIYLGTYLFTSIGAFGVVTLMSSPYNGDEAESMADYRGLFWRRPLLSSVLTVMLLSLAGIPLTAGFVGKFYIVLATVSAGEWWLAAAVILGSVIGLYYYLRVMVTLYMTAPEIPRTDVPSHWGVRVGGLMVLGSSLIVLILGIYPQPLIALASFAKILH